MKAPILEIEHLSVDYILASGRLRAVNDVSLSLNTGEILGVVGESGSGKSTLALALLYLLDRPGQIINGTVKYQGEPLQSRSDKYWEAIRGKEIGMIFQSPQNSFNPCARIGRQIEHVLRTHYPISQGEAHMKILNALDRVKMPRAKEVMNSYAFELSGGMCQRVALAAALVLEPKLLIADEPTSSLDLLNQVEITKLLEEIHRDTDLSMLIISHDIGFVSRLVSHIAVMHRGRFVDYDHLDRVLNTPRDTYTRTLLNAMPRLNRESQLGYGTENNSNTYARNQL